MNECLQENITGGHNKDRFWRPQKITFSKTGAVLILAGDEFLRKVSHQKRDIIKTVFIFKNSRVVFSAPPCILCPKVPGVFFARGRGFFSNAKTVFIMSTRDKGFAGVA